MSVIKVPEDALREMRLSVEDLCEVITEIDPLNHNTDVAAAIVRAVILGAAKAGYVLVKA